MKLKMSMWEGVVHTSSMNFKLDLQKKSGRTSRTGRMDRTDYYKMKRN